METDLNIPLGKSRRARLLASGIYFFIFAAVASVSPFFVLYLQSLGFSGAQIGAVTSLGPLLGLLGTPIWTGIADARNKHRVVLLGGIVVAVLVNSTLPLLRTYPQIFFAQMLLALLTPHMLALQDSATMHMLGDHRDRYGQVRIWGTVGWGASATIVGAALGHLGLIWMFWIYAGFMTVTAILASQLEFDRQTERTPYFKNVGKLLKNQEWLLLLGIAFVCGLGMAPHGNYLSLLVQEVDRQSGMPFFIASVSAMVGFALTISTVFEAPIMLGSHKFLNTLGSRGTLFLALGLIGIRNLLYGSTHSSEFILLIQILHGLTYPLLWIAGVSFVAEKTPRGLSATGQGMFSAAIGIGMSTGNYFFGWLIDQAGLYNMFYSAGLFVLASLVVFALLARRIR